MVEIKPVLVEKRVEKVIAFTSDLLRKHYDLRWVVYLPHEPHDNKSGLHQNYY